MFEKRNADNTISYHYKWTDKDDIEQSIAFALDKKMVNAIPQSQAVYRPSLAQRHVTVSLLKAARNVDPKKAIIDIRQQQERVNIGIKSNYQNTIEMLSKEFGALKDKAFEDYLYERYYMQYETPMREPVVKPDHIRYVGMSTEALIPLSQAFYEKLGGQSEAREYLNLLLGWLQSIPYDTLEDRTTSHGSGFSPPITVLNQNQGDCDSKSVIAASITRSFLPNTPMVMVFLRNHALLGLAIGAKETDDIITYNGVPYVLFDPTGPALFEVGQVSSNTRSDIAAHQYTVETIPKI